MRFRSVPRVVLLTFALGAGLHAPAHAEWPRDHRTPLRLTALTGGDQSAEAALPDGAGGAYALFTDSRTGDQRVHAAHVRGDGTLDPAWPAAGLAMGQFVIPGSVRALADDAGGFYVTWLDSLFGGTLSRNRVSRVLANGSFAPGFSGTGTPLAQAFANAQHAAVIVSDGSGGLMAVWEYDATPANHDIHGARVAPDGTIGWSGPLVAGGGLDSHPAVSSEGAIVTVAWNEAPTNLSVARFDAASGAVVTPPVSLSFTADQAAAPRACPDGWGGTYVFHVQLTNGLYNINGARFFAGALVHEYAFMSGQFSDPVLLGDAVYAGGFRAWIAYHNPAQRFGSVQSVTREGAGFATFIAPSADTPNRLLLAPDGTGGVVLALGAQEATQSRMVMATRRTATGSSAGLWSQTAGGLVPVMQLPGDALSGAMCSDGDGGALVFGSDQSPIPARVHVTRIDRWGALVGAPMISSVRDVANDEGGQVRLAWTASYLDRLDQPTINNYRLWRQVPVGAAQALLAQRAHAHAGDDAGPGTIRIDESALGVFAWELITTQAAAGFAAYSFTVPTVSDSSAAGPANTVYMVEARSTSLNVGWSSAPDSGRSVDNLAPAIPAAFTAAVQPAVTSTRLTWDANTEADLAGYALHRGTAADFVPNSSNRVAFTASTHHLDPSTGLYYKLAAVDTHGNHSPYAVVTPGGTLDTPGELAPRALALALESANPSSHGALLRYELPAAGRVTLQLYDVHGRVVRELLAGGATAGRHTLRWDGRDASGAEAASGMYFARLTLDGQVRVQRLVLSH